MDTPQPGLDFSPSTACTEIEEFIRTAQEKMQRDGAVVSVSGGLDSAVAAALTIRSLGIDKVHLLHMPERDSKPVHQKHARLLAKHLGTPLITRSITPVLRASGSYQLLPIGWIPGRWIRSKLVAFGRSNILRENEGNLLVDRLNPEPNSWFARGNAYAVTKHRMRMVVVYQYAEVHNLMVLGAANRTEWLTGTFSKWGIDHCADIMPLVHLYRSQLELVAEHLNLPAPIRSKPADPDVMPGIDDKGGLLGDFVTVDKILSHLETNHDPSRLYQDFNKELVDRILELRDLSNHMRESPYQIQMDNPI